MKLFSRKWAVYSFDGSRQVTEKERYLFRKLAQTEANILNWLRWAAGDISGEYEYYRVKKIV